MPVVEIVMPSQMPANVPAFLSKLWKMVDNPDTGKVDLMHPDDDILYCCYRLPDILGRGRSILPDQEPDSSEWPCQYADEDFLHGGRLGPRGKDKGH